MTSPPANWTAGDVEGWLPGFPVDRIRVSPTPGTATEQDILDVERQTGQICELIDGTLVDKVMASLESMLAAEIIIHIGAYLQTRDLGIVLGADGYLKLLPDQVRAPGVSFIRWERFPDHKLPKAAIYDVAPDLAVEVLSESNTVAEMNRKLRDYFKAGTSMVWYVDPPTRTALVPRDQAMDRYRPRRFAAGRRSAAGIRFAAGETVCTRRVSQLAKQRVHGKPRQVAQHVLACRSDAAPLRLVAKHISQVSGRVNYMASAPAFAIIPPAASNG